MAGISALVSAGLFGAGTGAEASPPAGDVSFSTVPSLFPNFSPNIYNYVVRCNNGPVTVSGHTSAGWEATIGNEPFRSGDFVEPVPLSSGRAFTIIVRQVGVTHPLYRYYVRCLPNNFPNYTFTRYGPVSPTFFSAEPYVRSLNHDSYAIIFDNHGVPIWWDHVPAHDTRVLPSGNILWFNQSSAFPNHWEIHRLDGSLVRTVNAVGLNADRHDWQPVGNGDYQVGAYVKRSHVDTSAYGGSSDATVSQTELQQVSSAGQLVWDWKSWQHISLAETPAYRWPWAINNSYDIQHWNSIQPAGNSVIASFRHLDAVYKIDKSTGNIVWKLGGTTTPESLTVNGDPYANTLGAQHDARLLGDGTVTVFDNRTNQVKSTPEAVRFQIDEQQRTATLLESITDPAVTASYCCGSARRLDNGDWLISWGKTNPIGGYQPNGARTFLLTFNSDFSYRAEPVPKGVITGQDLRHGMNVMCSSGCG
jgi:Arylsulfotransferase (ASST)